MRTQVFNKPYLPVLVMGAFCGAAAVLGAQALSKGQVHQPPAAIVKSSTADAMPAQAAARDRTVASEDASATPDSWKRWPSLTDF
jgi:hypothetical protein